MQVLGSAVCCELYVDNVSIHSVHAFCYDVVVHYSFELVMFGSVVNLCW